MEVVPRSRPTARAATWRGGGGRPARAARDRADAGGGQEALQDVGRHRYGNTNNLWVNLVALDRVLRERAGVLGLPMIVNRKTVDPSDKSSPEVFQLETAMGAAIEVFEGAEAIEVSRTRFAPVKTTNDLLVLRSDFYVLTEDAARRARRRARAGLDLRRPRPRPLQAAARLRRALPGRPAVAGQGERFVVRGDVTFGPDVAVEGETELESG